MNRSVANGVRIVLWSVLVAATFPAIVGAPLVIRDRYVEWRTGKIAGLPDVRACASVYYSSEGSPSDCLVKVLADVDNTAVKALVLNSYWSAARAAVPLMEPQVNRKWQVLAAQSIEGIELSRDWSMFFYKDVPILKGIYSAPFVRVLDTVESFKRSEPLPALVTI